MGTYTSYNAEPLLQRRFLLGEGPAYQAETDTLLWVDITTGTLFLLGLATGDIREIKTGQYLGAAVPTKKGRYLLALTTGVYMLDDCLKLICRPPELTANLRLNDGKCDQKGRFYFGTMSMMPGHTEEGSLFFLMPEGSYQRVLPGPQISNGIAWTSDSKTMYYADSPTLGVDAFDFDAEQGTLSNRRRIFTVTDGLPDGMTIDSEGMLWIAIWGGSKVLRVNPQDSSIIGEVPVPSVNTTSCCFGGKKLDKLFITSSGDGFNDPEAGQVFVAEPGVKGVPEPVFDDSQIE